MRTIGDERCPDFATYQSLLACLERLRHRLKWMALLEGFSRSLFVFLILAPILFLADNLMHLSVISRYLAFILLLLAIISISFASIRLALQPWKHERLAMRIEESFPALENRLINAVQLGKSGGHSLDVVETIVSQALQTTREIEISRIFRKDKIKMAGLGSSLCVLLIFGYAFFFPERFSNAAGRILLPGSAIPPHTRTQLIIDPGDTTRGKGETLSITANPSGDIPPMAFVNIRSSNSRDKFAMPFDGQAFGYTLAEVHESFAYQVIGGDYKSPWHKVKVLDKPEIDNLALRIAYPKYTGMNDVTIAPSDGSITALAGSTAHLSGITTKPVVKAIIDIADGRRLEINPTEMQNDGASMIVSKLEAKFNILKDSHYKILLRDKDNLSNEPSVEYKIQVIPDAAPNVFFSSPANESEVPQGEMVSVLFSATDDYGLSTVTLKEMQGDDKKVRFARNDLSVKAISDGCVLETSNLAIGDQTQFVLEATDIHGTYVEETLILKIGAPRSEGTAADDAMQSWIRNLLALLEIQKSVQGDMRLWRVSLGVKTILENTRLAGLNRLVVEQSRVRTYVLKLLESAAMTGNDLSGIRNILQEIEAKELREVIERMKEISPDKILNVQQGLTDEIDKLQSNIIHRLEEVLGLTQYLFPEMQFGMNESESKVDNVPHPRPESLTDLYGKALEFIDNQEGLLETLQRMEDIDPKDLGNRKDLELEDYAEKEDEWAEYFKDASEWLRKAPMVEATESGLIEELVEMYIEIEPLSEELRSDPVTIEVSEDEVGLELAEELTHNLEKWLPEEPDYQKWVMENASEEYEVPIAELPDELEDMMGELIETEADMSEAIEDITSNWADSLDAGVGWEAADGPISNYSAKGVTGNILPNDMDIAGRSGEGRTGRSLGEMVEGVTTGKGGRDTQTRITADAMGEGVVEDLSSEEVKGATGGGKVAGTTGWGLVTANAPVQPELIQKLAQAQSDLKMKSLDLSKNLEAMQLPSGHLQSAIEGMKKVGDALQGERYDNLKELHAVVVSDLKNQREVLRSEFEIRRDPLANEKRKLQHQIRAVDEEEFPLEYRALLSAYYESLSRQVK